MRIKPSVLLLIFLGALLASASATPNTTVATAGKGELVPPVPLVVVAPLRAPAGYENAIVRIQLEVDALGRPQHIEPLGVVPTEVRELLVIALKQWKFAPATRQGSPIGVCIILPLRLAVSL